MTITGSRSDLALRAQLSRAEDLRAALVAEGLLGINPFMQDQDMPAFAGAFLALAGGHCY